MVGSGVLREVIPADGQTADGLAVDDLFFLRYILSAKKNLEKASKRARENLVRGSVEDYRPKLEQVGLIVGLGLACRMCE